MVAVTLIGIAVSLAMNVGLALYNNDKQEEMADNQIDAQEEAADKAGARNTVNAIVAASAGSTNARVDGKMYKKQLNHIHKTKGNGNWVVAKVEAEKNLKARFNRKNYPNGNPVNNANV